MTLTFLRLLSLITVTAWTFTFDPNTLLRPLGGPNQPRGVADDGIFGCVAFGQHYFQ